MKILYAVLLALSLALSLAGCKAEETNAAWCVGSYWFVLLVGYLWTRRK